MGKFTAEERIFLSYIQDEMRPPLADRKQDRARQRLRRDGYVKFTRISGERIKRWHLTQKGADALSGASP